MKGANTMDFPVPNVSWEHVSLLRAAGPGALLVWSERHDGIVPVSADAQVSEGCIAHLHGASGVRGDIQRKQQAGAPYLDEDLMVIAAHHDLDPLVRQVSDSGAAENHPDGTDSAVGEELRDRAARLLESWPRLKVLTAMVADLRADLAGHGLHLSGPATIGDDGWRAFIAEEFRTVPDGEHRVRVKAPFAWDGTVQVTVGVAGAFRHEEELRPKWRMNLDVSTAYPGRAGRVVAASAAAAVASTPARF